MSQRAHHDGEVGSRPTSRPPQSGLPPGESRRQLLRRILVAAGVAGSARLVLPRGLLNPGRVIASSQPSADRPRYALPGPQVEPEASFWTLTPASLPSAVRMTEMAAVCDVLGGGDFFPPYPSDEQTREEVAELHDLAALRDDPNALVSRARGRERRPISHYLQIRPQPAGAVYDRTRAENTPVIRTGRELARWFEAETPGMGHRLALDFLLQDTNWSPPRQARVWMAMENAVYSGLLAAWHYKWYSDRDRVGYRPRPVEIDPTLNVLFDRGVNRSGTADLALRVFPTPSPGTPRHPAYPSGHSTASAAASEVMAYFFPDAREELANLCDNAGMARLWAGVHYRSDHEQGMRLGRHVAQMIVAQLEAGGVARSHQICDVAPERNLPVPQARNSQQTTPNATEFCDIPPTPEQVRARAEAFRRRM